ncbi:cell division protein DivIB [Lentibacillus halophilus]|uniref:Cell division protein DivIB n=1 Tax=Lentibacillus halophilus TaxID=295065 RepID=A0ABN0ZFG1_9BACI
MRKKNVVSIEDRIPTLKQERKKKANRRLLFYVSIFFLLLSVIVYLQSPLSDVRTITITGNSFVSDKRVKEAIDLSEGTNIWTVDKNGIIQAASSNPAIKDVDVERQLPWTIELHITETELVGYVHKNDDVYPVLGNGNVLTERPESSTANGNAPLLINFSEKTYLKDMAKELRSLPVSIRKLISEIHWKPEKDNKHNILLYMNDGNLVDGTIRHFADKISVYPSIVSQLDPDKEGILHIGVGAYFEEFESKESEAGERSSHDN